MTELPFFVEATPGAPRSRARARRLAHAVDAAVRRPTILQPRRAAARQRRTSHRATLWRCDRSSGACRSPSSLSPRCSCCCRAAARRSSTRDCRCRCRGPRRGSRRRASSSPASIASRRWRRRASSPSCRCAACSRPPTPSPRPSSCRRAAASPTPSPATSGRRWACVSRCARRRPSPRARRDERPEVLCAVQPSDAPISDGCVRAAAHGRRRRTSARRGRSLGRWRWRWSTPSSPACARASSTPASSKRTATSR